ncbi:EboA domain-containing protein [Streptomyces sp. NBC_01363]|uniref:EboA domain-containing protein n=1 Tax=Streptomyces sp. NBC_01363 TaxID=2903840 RepID=UPI002254F762|nr:EboA domain-containing protein [Streptomyces sp. NBC_01363]MCX4733324.1 EboA domain-containing protein [Streptomyces sp. NBC_01363]
MTAPDPTPTPAALRAALDDVLTPAGSRWLRSAEERTAASAGALAALFPAAGRACGTGRPAVPAGWTAADAARVFLLLAVPLDEGRRLAGTLTCYRYGDAAERRSVLRALPLLGLGPDAVELTEDALRSHDHRLVEAAVGPYAQAHLGAPLWRHAVLTCLFTGVPLTAVAGLRSSCDATLLTMLEDLVRERRAAGRPVPPDAVALLAAACADPPTKGA